MYLFESCTLRYLSVVLALNWNFLVYTYHDGGGVAFRRSLDSSPNQRHPKGNQSSPSSMYETFLLLLSSKKRMAIHLHTNNSYE